MNSASWVKDYKLLPWGFYFACDENVAFYNVCEFCLLLENYLLVDRIDGFWLEL